MTTPRDDDALSWDGDDDPTLDVRGDAPVRHRSGADAPDAEASTTDDPVVEPAPSPTPDTAPPLTPAPAETPAPAATGGDAERDPSGAQLGNAGLIGIGMVAATFLLFAIGWLVAGVRLLGAGLPIDDVAVIALTIGAALAPPAWFVATLALTRHARTWQRFLVLILGIVLLVPWPYLSTGALV